MKHNRLWLLAAVAALGVGFVPGLLPKGPGGVVDPSSLLASGHLVGGAAIVFIGGLLTALTPCVYPLIPITVGIFGGRKAETRLHAIALTSAYIVGMGLVFSVLGIVAARTGQAFGSLLGDPRVALGLALFLLVLASSMFGAFELTLPSGLVQRLNSVGKGGVGGALLMGGASGFLAAPCTGPVLTALLAFVAKSQSVAAGGVLLFIYALGIGVPFLLIGIFALRLPKGGPWMEGVKSVLGIALLALAVSYLRDALPAFRDWIAHIGGALGQAPGAWLAAIIAGLGVLIGAIHRSFKGRPLEVALKTCGILLLVGSMLLRGAALNASRNGEVWARWCESKKLFSTVADAFSVKICMASTGQPHEVRWMIRFPETDGSSLSLVDRALEQARSEGRPVMIDFSAEWCAACKELDRETYVDARVASEANGRFLTVRVDGTHELDQVDALYRRFDIQGLPTIVFISSTGEMLRSPRITGYIGPEKFLADLRKVR